MPSTTAATTANGASALSRSLERFFSDPCHFSILRFITTAADHKRFVSLRLIEWYVTDCVRHVVPNSKVVSEYADNLNIYTRKMFDPFRRGKQQSLRCGDVEIHTTVGQMNFFRWFIVTRLWDSVSENAQALSSLMASHPEQKFKSPTVKGKQAPVERPQVFSNVLSFD